MPLHTAYPAICSQGNAAVLQDGKDVRRICKEQPRRLQAFLHRLLFRGAPARKNRGSNPWSLTRTVSERRLGGHQSNVPLRASREDENSASWGLKHRTLLLRWRWLQFICNFLVVPQCMKRNVVVLFAGTHQYRGFYKNCFFFEKRFYQSGLLKKKFNCVMVLWGCARSANLPVRQSQHHQQHQQHQQQQHQQHQQHQSTISNNGANSTRTTIALTATTTTAPTTTHTNDNKTMTTTSKTNRATAQNKNWHKIRVAPVGMVTWKKKEKNSHRMRVTVLCTQRLSACTLLALYISGKLKVWPVVQNRRPHTACTRRINRKHNGLWFKTLGNMKSDGEK